jgi:hypothetical protein
MPPPKIHPPPSKTPPNPIRSHPDGVYFVNCQRGNEISSGLAYYRNMNPGANDGRRPDAYVDVSHGSFITWENAGEGKSLNPASTSSIQHPVPTFYIVGRFAVLIFHVHEQHLINESIW